MTWPLEFCFDLSSPWTYLAFQNIRPVARDAGVPVRWTPILVGGVFNAVNQSIYEARQAGGPKARHSTKALGDWAAWSGLPLVFPSPHHPLKSVAAMRFCCALEDDQPALERFAEAAFAAYFAEQRNLDDPAELVAVADGVGLDGAGLLAACAGDAVKDRLRANTQRLIDKGGFGSPSMFVDGDDMYFGNDQLPLVERALKRRTPA